MKEEVFKNITDTDELILALQNLYTKIMIQKQLLRQKGNINKELLSQYSNQVEKNIKELINNIKIENKKKIQMLEKIIENALDTEEDLEIKEKLNNIFKEFYELLKKQGEKIKEPNKDEKIVLKLINDSNVKIHEDKSEKDIWQYGDFSEKKDEILELVYHDKNMSLLNKSTYQATKTRKEAESDHEKIVASVSKSEISKYEFKIRYEKGNIASIEFFADTELGKQIKDGNLEYVSPMLAAIAKAKEQGKNYIGKISMIDSELGTFVTQYDDGLEESISNLIKKEQSLKSQDKESLEEVKE